MRYVFYVPGQYSPLDEAVLIDGVYYGMWTRQTLEQMSVSHPGVLLVTEPRAREAIKLIAIKPPIEISEDRYIEMLEDAVPVNWVRLHGEASFLMAQSEVANVTQIYVNLGNRFFCLVDVNTLKHPEIVAKVRAAFPDAY